MDACPTIQKSSLSFLDLKLLNRSSFLHNTFGLTLMHSVALGAEGI